MKNAATICAIVAAAAVPAMAVPQDINLSSLGLGDINLSSLGLGDINLSSLDISSILSNANALLSSLQSDIRSLSINPAEISSILAGMSDMPDISGMSGMTDMSDMNTMHTNTETHSKEETAASSGVSPNHKPVLAGVAAAVSIAMAALI
ncbi:hypothetical protein GGI23_003202 [Coemansia sp. RSA 2559]|nr:hypothetical protein GGI23_003202 [Coemansia sp. RSA 2559]KAJ2865531.1 hypothetical protein GGI22_001482 [Coemansia erecta]